MIKFDEYLNNYLTVEESKRFISNTKRFKLFYNRNKNKSAYFSFISAFDFAKTPEGKEYWDNRLKQINDVVFTYHANGNIKSIIPIQNGKIHKYCYFLDQNEKLHKIIKHCDLTCSIIFEN